jgi:hypothetical protein
MTSQKLLTGAIIVIGAALILSGCGKKTVTDTNTQQNINAVITEAPYIMSGTTKIFSLKLINGQLNYKTMTFLAGDSIQIRLTSDAQPVDFKFREIPDAASTAGIFNTNIQDNDPGGTYYLICKDRECGSITVTVVPKTNTNSTTGNTNQITNTASNTNTTNQITKVELQRIPAGTGFTPANTYETTTSFEVGDQFGLGVTGDFIVGAKLAHDFTDSTGKSIEAQTTHPDLRAGTNGSCCYSLPTSAGSFDLNVYINGDKAETVPITMTPK